ADDPAARPGPEPPRRRGLQQRRRKRPLRIYGAGAGPQSMPVAEPLHTLTALPLPSALAMNTPWPARAKAIARPLGENAGSSLEPSFWVTRIIALLSRSSVTMSYVLPSRVVYAMMCLPLAGDHVGVVL